jgi:hypothetical protein
VSARDGGPCARGGGGGGVALSLCSLRARPHLHRARPPLFRELDEKFLCAATSTSVVATLSGAQLELRVAGDGSLVSMPARDAVMLPIANSSVEELAALLARRIVARLGPARLRARNVERVTLSVSEAPGQEAAVAVDVAGAGDDDAA